MDKFIIVLCEGDHDIAFLSRLLLTKGFYPYDKKVDQFFRPLKKMYIAALEKKEIKDIKFKFQRHDMRVPYAVFTKEDTLVIFHNLSGDGNILNGKAKNLVDSYLKLNDEILREADEYERLNYRFLYFLDADDQGVSTRLSEVGKILNMESNLDHYTLMNKDDYEVGCCIFHDSSCINENGKLENILLDLMKNGNDNIFEESQSFLEGNLLDELRQRKFVCNITEEKPDGSIQFKKEKSIISVAGQLQFSGSSNSVIIANSDYIRRNDIEENSTCQSIIKMFS